MHNNNEIYTIATLPTVLCAIPIYQRLFVWDKEQINKLLDDLYEAFKVNSGKYYIGAITVVEKKDEENQINWEIVDGQQRLTFLSLFGAMSCKENMKWNDFLYMDKNSFLLRMKYIGRYTDENDLSSIAKGDTNYIHNQNMRWFSECYNSFMEEKSIDMKDFSEFVRTKATFMRSVLSSDYSDHELNLYFERINATGRQLEPQELVKSSYFSMDAALFNRLIDFSCKYEEKENDNSKNKSAETTFEQILKNDNFDAKLYNEPSITSAPSNKRAIFSESTFLLHVLRLVCTNETSLNQYSLLNIFKTHSNAFEVKQYMDEMRTYRKWLDENIIYQDEDGYVFRQEDKENIEVETVRTQDRQKLLQYQAMLTVESANQEWVLKAYEKSQRSVLTLETLKSVDIRALPSQESMIYHTINRYWFWKLDYLLWNNFMVNNSKLVINGRTVEFSKEEQNAIKNYKFRPNRSIEHLHPQTSETPWNDEDLHSFGNLAMISSNFNSAQSNDGVATKFGRLRDRINKGQHLESIKLLLMFKLVEGNESRWTKEIANEHGEAMYMLLNNSF